MPDLIPSYDRMCYVYRLPDDLANGYTFGGGVPISFLNVDWFQVTKVATQEEVENFVKKKNYVIPGRTYLVLVPGSPELCFTFKVEPEQLRAIDVSLSVYKA